MLVSDCTLLQENIVHTPHIELCKGSRKVVLMGVSHVGSPAFYDSITRQLDEYERNGYLVLYESVDGHLGLDLPASLPLVPLLKEKWKALDMALEPFGLAFQQARIYPAPSWILADLTTEEWKRLTPGLRSLDETVLHDWDGMIQKVSRLVEAIFTTFGNSDNEIRELFIIRDYRNQVAVQYILKYAAHSNIVTYWGASHIPGIRNLLVEQGYEVVNTSWQPCFALN